MDQHDDVCTLVEYMEKLLKLKRTS